MKVRDRIADIDFSEAVDQKDPSLMRRYVAEIEKIFLDAWLSDHTRENFGTVLRLADQKSARARRDVEIKTDEAQITYHLGIVDGVIYVFRELFRAEKRESKIVETAGSQSAKTDRILQYLYEQNNGQGMRHGELADQLGISYSNLTNTMKRILQSGAVESARAGKNTFYRLTPAGKRYCARKKQPEALSVPTKEKLIRIIWDILNDVDPTKREKSPPMPTLRPGDTYYRFRDGKSDGQHRLRSIVTVDGEQYIAEELVEAESENREDADAAEWTLSREFSDLMVSNMESAG